MSNALSQVKHRLAIGLDREQPFFEPLIADQWVIKSLLQKSIRRGEVDIAQRAALTFLAQKGSAIWRRFIIIAFEDIGVGSVEVVAMTVAASTVAETIRRRRRSCFLSGSSIGRSTKKPVCRALDHEFRSASVVGAREGEGLFQLDCGQSGRSRG